MQYFVNNGTVTKNLSNVICDAVEQIDTSNDHGKLMAGLHAATQLAWDSQLFGLRLRSVTDATFITGLPSSGDHEDFAAVVAACLSAAARLGLNWNWAGQGPVYQHIVARPDGDANTNSTPDVFAKHTDDAALGLAFAPEWIVLVGQDNVAAARTSWVDSRRLLEGMPRAFLTEARSARWMRRVPLSLGLGEQWAGPAPLLFGPDADGAYQLAAATYAVRPADADSRLGWSVLDWIRERAEDLSEWVEIGPGSALLVPNRFGMHGRDAIRGDRRVVRTYANRDLRQHRKIACIEGQPWLFDPRKVLLSQRTHLTLKAA